MPGDSVPSASSLGAARIERLPTLVVNQIAAGEVVERPASVVKELVENALDAGPTRITIELESGGIELIRVTDDGRGIEPDDLPLTVAPHATSKVRAAGDLDRIATMGFRGEALASISSVSRVRVQSRTARGDGAMVLEAEGDVVRDAVPGAGPIGTSVAARNLFFNTPARRKFLRTPATEQARCVEVARALAMAHPAIAFRVTTDGRVALDVPGEQSPRERVLAVIGRELESQLLEVSADRFDDARGLTLWGLAGLPAIARGTNKHQHVFLNGRLIRDKTIQHAIKEAYRGLIEPTKHPTCVLMIEMSPEGVDVNVHPGKIEVRFRDSSMVHQTVLRAVRDRLREADLTPTFVPRAARDADRGQLGEHVLPMPTRPADPMDAERFATFFTRTVPERAGSVMDFQSVRAAAGETAAPASPAETTSESAIAGRDADADLSGRSDAAPASEIEATPSRGTLQVHNSYVITQDEAGVVIVDQHALHERAMFEHLLRRIAQGPLERQSLLTPVAVETTESRIAGLDALGSLLDMIGVELVPLGPRTIGVRAFPSFLFERNVDPVVFVTELLEKSEDESFVPDHENAMRDVLDMMACKAAVKAGDHLSGNELDALLDLRDAVERSASCPHGRPTSVRLTIKELEKLFHRS